MVVVVESGKNAHKLGDRRHHDKNMEQLMR